MTATAVVNEAPTPASVWQTVAGTTMGDDLLDWPPDLFALTEMILERSQAYRFALSPPAGTQWRPAHTSRGRRGRRCGPEVGRLGRGPERSDTRPSGPGMGGLPGRGLYVER